MLQFVVASALIATAAGYGNNLGSFNGGYRQSGGYGQVQQVSLGKVQGFGANTQGYGAGSQGYGAGQFVSSNRVAAIQPVSGAAFGSYSAGGYGGASRNFGSQGALLGVSRGAYASQTVAAAPQTVQAAIQTTHNVEYRDVESTGSVNPITVEVGANSIPVTLLFRSASSSLNVQQVHDGAQGSTQETSSEDEPHVLKHSVTKPVIQELREVITPYRKITQEIQPVQEQVLTIVARNQGGSSHAVAAGGVQAVNTGANFVSNKVANTGASFVGNNVANTGATFGGASFGGASLANTGSSYGGASLANTGASYGGANYANVGQSSSYFSRPAASYGASSSDLSKGFTGFTNFGGKLSGSTSFGTSKLQAVQNKEY